MRTKESEDVIALRRMLDAGIEQLDSGDCVPLTEQLIEGIIATGRKQLNTSV